jgi:hypothetical protein
MAKVKDGKIIKEETNFLGGSKKFKTTTNPLSKNKTTKQQRDELIKNRDARLKSDAKKQGISVDELKKKRSDTYSTVLSPLTMLPVGRALNLAGKAGSKVSKFLKGGDKTKKTSQTSSSTSGSKLSKTTQDSKPSSSTSTKTLRSFGRNRRPTGRTRRKMPVNTNLAESKPNIISRAKDFVKRNKKPIGVGLGATAIGSTLLSGGKTKGQDKKIETPIKRPDIKKPDTNNKKTPDYSPRKGMPKKSSPTKDYTGKFVNEKGEVAYDSVGDFFRNITGTAKKRERPENRKIIQAETKGATKGVGFSGKSVGNPFKFNKGGPLKQVPSDNKGLGKLPQPVRNKMGYMKKGGVVKMRGGGAASRGMNFNRGY